MNKTYDSYEGICESLNSFNGFNELINERFLAGYKRGERLNTWYVLGRYILDSCGNVGVATKEFIPSENIPNFPKIVCGGSLDAIIYQWQKEKEPDVLTREEINREDFSYSDNKRPYPISVSFSMKNPIPPSGIVCNYCGEKWNIENLFDVYINSERSDIIGLDDFVGRTYADVKRFFNKDKTSKKIFHENYVRNDRHIDLTPDEKYPVLKKNENGWINTSDDYVICEGDEIDFSMWKYFHLYCLKNHAKNICEEHRKTNGKDYSLQNLAGVVECNPYISLELELAEIGVIPNKGTGEVPYSIEGILELESTHTFKRAWRYWVVEGNVPLDIAISMYEDEEGKSSVRVAGHCGCPHPNEYVKWINPCGQELVSIKYLDGLSENIKKCLLKDTKFCFVEDPKDPKHKAKPFITNYHIDTWQGLKLYVSMMKA